MTRDGDVSIPGSARSALDEIPIFDATACFNGDPGALQTLADQVRHAQEEIGFYYLTGHGVAQDLIGRTFDAIAAFFALPEDEKFALKVNEHQIGYIPPKASLLKTSVVAKDTNTKRDTNEAFQLMRDLTPHDPKIVEGIRFYGLNQWPDTALVPGMRAIMAEYHDVMSRLGWRMLPVYSVALGLEANHLYQYFRDPHFLNRNAHYAPGTPEDNQFGLGPTPTTASSPSCRCRKCRGWKLKRKAASGLPHRTYPGRCWSIPANSSTSGPMAALSPRRTGFWCRNATATPSLFSTTPATRR